MADNMIHICMAVHDKTGHYSKYAAVTLCSVFEKTNANICVHMLCDGTVTSDIKDKFIELCNRYGNTVKFYLVDISRLSSIESMTSTFTIGTLFRLMMPSVISSSITKILYLDADIIANIDVLELWNKNIDDYYCAACKDPGVYHGEVSPSSLACGLVDADVYCNAGVVLYNLAKIRSSMDFFKESVSFLQNNPRCIFSDQDAINYLFKDKILFLDSKWNIFSRHIREKESELQECIYHISGDYVETEKPESFDELFFKYLHNLNWQSDERDYYIGAIQAVQQRFELYRNVMLKLYTTKCKKVFWGCGSDHIGDVFRYIPVDPEQDYYVDSNVSFHGSIKDNMVVKAPKVLLEEDKENIMVIVVSKVYYKDIKKMLQEYGYEEGINFVDGIALLSNSQHGYGEYY